MGAERQWIGVSEDVKGATTRTSASRRINDSSIEQTRYTPISSLTVVDNKVFALPPRFDQFLVIVFFQHVVHVAFVPDFIIINGRRRRPLSFPTLSHGFEGCGGLAFRGRRHCYCCSCCCCCCCLSVLFLYRLLMVRPVVLCCCVVLLSFASRNQVVSVTRR